MANISKVAAQASMSTEGFDDAIEVARKTRKEFMQLRDVLNKIAVSWKGPKAEEKKDPEDSDKKKGRWAKRAAIATGAIHTAVKSIAAIGTIYGIDKLVGGIMDIGSAMFEVDRQARHMGARTEDLMAFQWAVKRVGEDAEEGTHALNNLYDAFISAGDGGRMASMALNGLLKKGAIDQSHTQIEVLNDTVDALGKIAGYTERVVKLRTAFGSRAAAMTMIPYVSAATSNTFARPADQPGGGAAGLLQLPKALGAAISSDEVGVLRETARKFEDAALIFKGSFTQMTIGLAPFVQMLTNWINKQGLGGEGAGLNIGAFFLTLAEDLHDFALDLLNGLAKFAYVAVSISRTFLDGVREVATVMQTLIDTLIIVVNTVKFGKDVGTPKIPIGTLDEYIAALDKEKVIISKDIVNRENKKYHPFGKGEETHRADNLKYLKGFLGLQGKDAIMDKSRVMQSFLAQNDPLIAAAIKMNSDNATPFEKYKENLNIALSAQVLPRPTGEPLGAFGSPEMFGRAVNKNLLAFEQSMGWHNVQLPTAVRQNTAAAESAVAKSKLEYDMQVVDTPQKRMERAQIAGNKSLQDIAAYSLRVAQAAEQQKGKFPW